MPWALAQHQQSTTERTLSLHTLSQDPNCAQHLEPRPSAPLQACAPKKGTNLSIEPSQTREDPFLFKFNQHCITAQATFSQPDSCSHLMAFQYHFQSRLVKKVAHSPCFY